MPLAILKATVADLPLQFTLDDSLAMAPMAKISNHQEVMLLARVSRSSSAVPQSGDLEGVIEKVKVGARPQDCHRSPHSLAVFAGGLTSAQLRNNSEPREASAAGAVRMLRKIPQHHDRTVARCFQ